MGPCSPAQHHRSQKGRLWGWSAGPQCVGSLCLSGFLLDSLDSWSLPPPLSSAPSPQAEGGAGEIRGSSSHTYPEQLRGRGRQRRGREPGMEARRAERETEGTKVSTEPLRERICGEQAPALLPGGDGDRAKVAEGQQLDSAPAHQEEEGPGAAGGAGPDTPLGQ